MALFVSQDGFTYTITSAHICRHPSNISKPKTRLHPLSRINRRVEGEGKYHQTENEENLCLKETKYIAGATPQISAKEDNGIYYRTLNGDYLRVGGKRLRVTGEPRTTAPFLG